MPEPSPGSGRPAPLRMPEPERISGSICACQSPALDGRKLTQRLNPLCDANQAGRKRHSDGLSPALKYQRLGLLDLRQFLHLAEHLPGLRAVHFHRRDGIAALLVATEMEGRDVDLGIAEDSCEVADESRLVLVGDGDHKLAEFG